MSVGYYHGLLSDTERIDSVRKAIGEVVTPADDVLEIGTGLGTYALFAAQAGAHCVWAMDGSPIIHVADTIAKINGYGDTIRCVRGWAPELDLPKRVQVLIFEDFASRLLDTRTYRMLRDSIAKYLEPGGRMIPATGTVLAAPVSSKEVRQALFPLDGLEGPFEIDWSPSYSYMQNAPSHHWLPEAAIAAEPQELYGVDFPSLPDPANMGGTFVWEVEPGSTIHGLVLWFELGLQGGGQISNRPAPRSGPWGQTVLPLDPPIIIDESAQLSASITVDAAPDGAPGWLGWTATSGDQTSRGHEFAAAPAALEDLMGTSEPSLTSRPPETETL